MGFQKVANVEMQKQAAYLLYKYQDFKGRCVPDKIRDLVKGAYNDRSLIAMHSLVRAYLSVGKMDLKRVTRDFYTQLDELKKQHLTPLTPKEQERARQFAEKPRKTVKNPVKIIKPANKEPQIAKSNDSTKLEINPETLAKIKFNNSIIYGLQLDSNLKMFESKDIREGYIMAYKDIDPSMTFRKVKLVVEVEED